MEQIGYVTVNHSVMARGLADAVKPSLAKGQDLKTLAVVVASALVLLAPAAINGAPFFYYDSAAYIEVVSKAVKVLLAAPAPGTVIPEGVRQFGVAEGDGNVLGGRSLYYGMLAYLGWIGGIWIPAAVQSLTLSWLLVAHVRAVVARSWTFVAGGMAAVLAVATSAGLFAGLVMPDIWSGLAILALALLWTPVAMPRRGADLAILAILSFSTLSHDSHLALVMVLLAGLASIGVVKPAVVSRRGIVIPASAILIGLAGQIAFSASVRVVYGQPPLARPFLTAHLVEMGPGTRLAQETCPQSGYALCRYRDRLPTNWIAFLFSKSSEDGVFAAADGLTQRALSDEQGAFVLATVTAYPLETLGGLARDGVRQLWTLSVDDVPITRDQQSFLQRNFPPDLAERIERSLIYGNPGFAGLITRGTQISTAIAALVMAIFLGLRLRLTASDGLRRIDVIVVTCLAGVIANALICGILASPYGRFQARVTWILPMLSLLLLATHFLPRQVTLTQKGER
jgi:hypothetical protein